jgi:hypothetical protein
VDNYEEGLLFNPIAATQRGDNRYNDLLPNDIAAPYLKKQHDFTIKYQKLLKALIATNSIPLIKLLSIS